MTDVLLVGVVVAALVSLVLWLAALLESLPFGRARRSAAGTDNDGARGSAWTAEPPPTPNPP